MVPPTRFPITPRSVAAGVALTAALAAFGGLGLSLMGQGLPVPPLPVPAPRPFIPSEAPPPATLPFPVIDDPVQYCRTWLDEPMRNDVRVIADANRTLRVERFHAREANLSQENALLLKTLGWSPAVTPLDAIMDVRERVGARCTLSQRVDLSKENALAWLALDQPIAPVDARGLADVVITAEVARDTVHTFDLDREEVLAVLALSQGEPDPRLLLQVADVERHTNESASLVQRVVLESGDVLVAEAVTGAGATGLGPTPASQGPPVQRAA